MTGCATAPTWSDAWRPRCWPPSRECRAGPGVLASVFSRAPLSPAAEAYRHLRARLEPMMAVADRRTVLLVASGGIREGRTSVAANLATALAHAGRTVVLVDADLRRPALSTLFQTGTRPGLTDLLAGRASVEEVAVPTDVPGLKLVTVGKLTGASADLFEGSVLTRTFAQMRTQAEVVVVDSAPTRALSDAVTLARVSDITILVADLRRTHRGDASAAVQDLRAAEPPAIVGVLNNVRRSRRRHQARSRVPGGPTSLLPVASVPSALAAAVPPRGSNGTSRISFGPSDSDEPPTISLDPK